MFYILLFLAVAAFYYYFKTYGKEDFLGRASRGAKGFGKGFCLAFKFFFKFF